MNFKFNKYQNAKIDCFFFQFYLAKVGTTDCKKDRSLDAPKLKEIYSQAHLI